LYDFVWHDVCDRYLEAIKPTIDENPDQQVVLGLVLDTSLRLMHPVCPFVTETLWPHVSEARSGGVIGVDAPPADLLALAAWPNVDEVAVDPAAIPLFDRANSLVGLVRALRSERDVKPRQRVTLHVTPQVLSLTDSAEGVVETLAGIGAVVPLEERPAVASSLAFEGSEILVSGLVDESDLDAERARLAKIVDAKSKQIGGFETKLANEGYVNNAKPELVQETRDRLAAARADLDAANAALKTLG
ncbi:MAG: class I tRNA ligase family protein, partial [Acidimicrobiales bacterium]